MAAVDISEWLFYASYYIRASLVLLKEAKGRLAKNTNNSEVNGLVIPAIYNFKHGIELFLKFLGQHNFQLKTHHNIKKYLQDVFPLEFGEGHLERAAKFTGLSIDDISKFNMRAHRKIKRLVDKYNRHEYLKIAIGEDEKNTKFRYPDKRISECIRKMSIRDVSYLIKDADFMSFYIFAIILLFSEGKFNRTLM